MARELTLTKRSGQAVDSGIPISDVIRDPRVGKLSDDAIAHEVRYRWRAGIDFSRDLRTRQWVRNALMTYSDLPAQAMWSARAERWLGTPLRKPRPYRTPLLPGRVAFFSAKMVQNAPEWTTIPASDSVSDEETARFCDKVLKYAYEEQRLDVSRYFSVIQMCIYGFGLLETSIDEEAEVVVEYEQEVDDSGLAIINPETNLPVYKVDGRGKPRVSEVTTKPGIRIKPVSPHAFSVPPGLEWPLLSDSPYLQKCSMLSEAYIRRKFKVKDSEVLSPDSSPGYSAGHFESMASYLSQIGNPQASPLTRNETGKLLVIQYYEPPRDVEGFYEGKVYTVCGDKLIGNEPALFEDGRYPFFMFPWLPVTDSFYPMPWLNPQVDPQSRIDQTTTHMMEHLALVGSPNVLADRGSMFPPKPVFGYKVFFGSPGMRRPEFMQAPDMPTGAYQMRAMAQSDLDEAGSSFPLARGESVKGITSGFHARAIQDADQTEMGPIAKIHAAEFGRLGVAVLDLYREFGGEDKMLALVGDDGACDYFSFTRSKIPLRMRVKVQEESLLAHYKSALEERANGIAGAGGFGNMLTDPQAAKRYLKAIRDPKMNGPLTPEEMQKKYLDEIHYSILHKGKVPPLEPWWNLAAHREAAQERLCRESLRWDKKQKEDFMMYWSSIEQAIQKMEAEAKASALEDAKTGIELQGHLADLEANAKAKVEFQRGANKLAVESMKDPKNQGAGAGAGIFGGSEDGEDDAGEKEPAEKGAKE